MKCRTLLAALIGAGGLLAPSAYAQVYAGASYSMLELETSTNDVNMKAVTGRLGYQFMPFLAVEVEGSVGAENGEYQWPGGSQARTKVGVENQVGAFAVGRVPLPVGGTLFGRLGYHALTLDESTNDLKDGNGAAYGAGVEFGLLPGIEARLEYTEYQGMRDNVRSFGLGAQMKF
jgi:opacity protein-like surface antigen